MLDTESAIASQGDVVGPHERSGAALEIAKLAVEQDRELLIRLLADQSRRLRDQTQEIEALSLRVWQTEKSCAEEFMRRQAAADELAAVRLSSSWRMTAPMRFGLTAMRRLLRPVRARIDIAQRALVKRDPEARRIVVASLRRRLGKRGAQLLTGVGLVRLLAPHESVVASYAGWQQRLDTPDADTFEALVATTEARPPLSILLRFSPLTLRHAAQTLSALQRSVGVRWTAFVVVDPQCDQAAVAALRTAFTSEPRISFDKPEFEVDEFVVLMEAGALPRAHGLCVFVDSLLANPGSVLVYADEDRLQAKDEPSDPWFKPLFSPLLNQQGVLLGKMVALRVGRSSGQLDRLGADSRQSLAEVARDIAKRLDPTAIVHVPHVLFHDIGNVISPVTLPLPPLPDPLPVVSVIIPTRDGWHLLGPCLESLKCTNWPADRMEIIVVDNGSTEADALEGMSRAEQQGHVRILRDPRAFNYSRLNNEAARVARGDILVLLNNDTEIIDPTWLSKLVAYAVQPGVGAVGPKLLFGDRTVQHGGVVLGIHGVAGHAHLFLDANAGGYHGLANLTHEVSAVTGACLAVSRTAYEEVGGLREDLRVAFNDVMLCLDLHARGRRNVYVAEPLVVHHESKTRGYDDKPEKVQLLRKEARYTWGYHAALLRNDPFYSPNLSLETPYGLACSARRRPSWSSLVKRPRRVMMLSSTHAKGHGVAVVVDLQVRALVERGYEVIIGGALGNKDFDYGNCRKIEIHDPRTAATLAMELDIDVIVAHTPPYFDVARWTGAYPPVIAYDYGEPPPKFFPDAPARQEVLDHKALSLAICSKVFAISEAVARDSVDPPDGIIPLGNGHLGRWSSESEQRREKARRLRNWEDHIVVLNVCRFHVGERFYKGVDQFCAMRKSLEAVDPVIAARTIFVLCGKGDETDVSQMRANGLYVAANVSDEEMAEIYAAADVYANFSRWEGYNLGIGQALAMGLPVIASDIPAHRAFGVAVTNDASEAALFLREQALRPGARIPTVWEWDRPLALFVDEIDAACSR
ncbi:glycosyltransferase [Paraburkholderia sp. A1RO-5]|uniref:glycosyltransferase n=1 Tax=Paraburkholderia sp. A1RO-5 TaxID=3028369 RepID=UPI003B79992E